MMAKSKNSSFSPGSSGNPFVPSRPKRLEAKKIEADNGTMLPENA
jgi:hypothetical protein